MRIAFSKSQRPTEEDTIDPYRKRPEKAHKNSAHKQAFLRTAVS